MSPLPPPDAVPGVGTVTVRYWAAARAAAGLEADPGCRSRRAPRWPTCWPLVGARHADRPRLAEVLSVCSVLVGERPVGTADPAAVPVRGGRRHRRAAAAVRRRLSR